jgi:hypothetical protein
MRYTDYRPGVWCCILAFATVASSIAEEGDELFDLVREDAAASIQAKIRRQELAATPISSVLCSNFIEAGFRYQVEGLWSEMLYNRSFEKWVPLRPNTARWYDLENVAHGDWTSAPWYQS